MDRTPTPNTRVRMWAAVTTGLGTASGITINFATDLRTDPFAWIAVAIVAAVGVLASLGTQPMDPDSGRSVLRNRTSRWAHRSRTQCQAARIHVEIIEETAAGGRVLVRAYTEGSASLLIAAHSRRFSRAARSTELP